MIRFRVAAALVIVTALTSPRISAATADYDVLIRGGTIYDGRGGKPFTADVALKADRIAAVGDLGAAQAKKIVEAKGLVVAPGFIDTHSHFADHELLQPKLAGAEPLLAQGVTTAFINADGWGLVDLAAQRALITKAGPGINTAPMIGHKPVRMAVLGMTERTPDAAQLAEMVKLVRTAFERDGAFGLSTGLIYAPAKFAKTDEIVALAKVASEFGGFYHSHIREEGEQVLTAIDELITIARDARLTAVVTHIKVVGAKAWGKSTDVIRRIEEARAAGLSVWADQYPYEAGMTFLSTYVLSGWAEADGLEKMRARLADPATRARIREEGIANLEKRGGPSAFLIGRNDADPSVQGRRLDAIARERGLAPIDFALQLIERGEPHAMVFAMRDDDIVRFMRQPWTMTGSDGFGVAEPHPRSYGTFPRKLQVFALERKIISLEQAIRSMTGLPAEVLGLSDRGAIRAGAIADVVVFDQQKLRATSTYEASRKIAEGMVHVYVNGQAAIADGKFTGARAGQVLSRRK
jgi:N-acyl-D-amino-acid deacylase